MSTAATMAAMPESEQRTLMDVGSPVPKRRRQPSKADRLPETVERLELFAQRLQAMRIKRGLGKKELEIKAGLSNGRIGKYETLKDTPSLDAVARIAEALGCTVDYLTGVNEIRAPKPARPGVL
jgi:DNA-binding XRE family transcriptional regulator